MKKFFLVALPILLLAVGMLCARHLARAAEDPAKLQREKGLRLHVEIQQELLAKGQTNLATKVDQMVQSMLLQQSTHKLRTQVGVLRRLRDGGDVIESLESDLDDTIVFLSHFDELGPDQFKALQAAKAYRAKYPRKTDSPETDAEVARILNLGKEK